MYATMHIGDQPGVGMYAGMHTWQAVYLGMHTSAGAAPGRPARAPASARQTSGG